MIYQGPNTTAELVCIMLRFLKEAVAASTDIEELFMQVNLPEFDQGALRFLRMLEGDIIASRSDFE